MRLYEIHQGYELRFVKDKWYINDQPISNDDAKKINARLSDIACNSGRHNYAKLSNDYLRAAYDVAKSKAAGTF